MNTYNITDSSTGRTLGAFTGNTERGAMVKASRAKNVPYSWLVARVIESEPTHYVEPSETVSPEARALRLIAASYAAHGLHTLACDCGAEEVTIDSDAIGNRASAAQLMATIEHARYDHVTPRNVLATVHVIIFDTHNI